MRSLPRATARLSPVRASRTQPGVSAALPLVNGQSKNIPLPREGARGWALLMMNDELGLGGCAAVASTLAMLAFSGRLPVSRKALRGEPSSRGTR